MVWACLGPMQGSTPNQLFCLECSGLVVYADGPLNLDRKVEDMSELFRPFHTLLRKIRCVCWGGYRGGRGAEGSVCRRPSFSVGWGSVRLLTLFRSGRRGWGLGLALSSGS